MSNPEQQKITQSKIKVEKMAKNNSLQVRIDDLLQYDPLTAAQGKAFEHWGDGSNLVLAGSAGTGKTFVALYLALEAALQENTSQDKVVVIRSVVPTRDIGFLPGTIDEKKEAYTAPYRALTAQLFGSAAIYNKLTNSGQLLFETTSFIRGVTFNNAVIVVDEMQNLNFHELDSVITRAGKNCRFIFSGDYYQSDFSRNWEKKGLYQFINIIDHMPTFETVAFQWSDIVRSDLVRDYIMTKEMLGFS